MSLCIYKKVLEVMSTSVYTGPDTFNFIRKHIKNKEAYLNRPLSSARFRQYLKIYLSIYSSLPLNHFLYVKHENAEADKYL
jgi:hypothetical protein